MNSATFMALIAVRDDTSHGIFVLFEGGALLIEQ